MASAERITTTSRTWACPSSFESIEKLDDHTVRFRLTRPEAPFLADLAMPFNIVQSAEYAEKLLQAGTPEKFDAEPIGTGPFAFAGFQPDVAVRYRAFEEYWAGKRAIDTLIFSITPNAAVRLTKLKAGECHVMAFPNPDDREEIEADPELKILQQEGMNIGYLAMNTSTAAAPRSPRAARHQHGDRQGGDHRGRLSRRRDRGEESDPADALVLQRRDRGLSLRSRPPRSSS